MTSMNRFLVLGTVLAALAGCPGGKLPGGGVKDPRGGGDLGPNACGDINTNDAGRKITAFLEAAVTLQKQVEDLDNQVGKLCRAMGEELGMSGLADDTKTACNAVAEEIRGGLKASLKAEAKFIVKYKPAECRVNMEAAVQAQAQCEGKATAEVDVTCQGECSGTCSGRCSGTCKATNADGTCAGECDGTCEGSCSGTCNGAAKASGSAECQASAEVKANMEAECTPPELDIQYDAKLVVDKPRLDKIVAAIKKGLPGMLALWAKANGPVMVAVKTFGKAAADLAGSANDIAKAFGSAAMCVAAQLSAAASAVASIEVHVEVSVEASASVGGACGAQSSGG
jgi:hypothetical protein